MKEHRYAIIVSRFNEHVTEKLLKGALERLAEKKIQDSDITVIRVPGAVEIPLAAQLIAKKGRHSAIICLGAVIRGETSHYDSVCQQVSQGCQRVMLDYSIPVIFGILTTENDEQALDRAGGTHGHKGKDAVDTAMEMAHLASELTSDGSISIGYY
ncbi:6,7-dimethyl-8-ribityllumazine synthase [Aquicella siphonis]|uniref:6,7-dimethyl-8-ribityllumazine synthase n=1 Tax=Aquicella siphonis TaxID=254247 RepID=A0A5E4PL32_9COXI|nr:6,7-dimethyl-8-ribityllumazine synthase [Aquicella siphonis]VVC77033.1 6,7-dimethyl-8-ribityllumazine synthase [Aquicella siphonis]